MDMSSYRSGGRGLDRSGHRWAAADRVL